MPTFTVTDHANSATTQGIEAATADSAVTQIAGDGWDMDLWTAAQTDELPVFPNYSVRRWVEPGPRLEEMMITGTLATAIEAVHGAPEWPWYIVRDTDGLRLDIEDGTWGPEFPE